MKDDFEKTVFLIFLSGITLRIIFSIIFPVYPAAGILPGYNDEPFHLNYVKHIAEERELPRYELNHENAASLDGDEFHQAPLYYVLCAPLYSLGEIFNAGLGHYFCRILSVICGLIAAIYTFKITLLQSRRRIPAYSAMILMSMSPNAVIFTSLVTNDAMMICVSAIAMYSLSMSRLGSEGIIRYILTGILFGLLVWTKLSGLLLLPLLWFSGNPNFRTQEQWKARIVSLLISLCLIIPLFLWRYNYSFTDIPALLSNPRYSPQQAVGVDGGGLFHPFMATGIFLRLLAHPLLDLWGSLQEKIVTVFWLIIWIPVFAFGFLQSFERSLRGFRYIINLLNLCLVTFAFIVLQIFTFQVEPRLLAPSFCVVAIIVALGLEKLKIPYWLQALLLSLPLLMLPFY